MSDTSLLTKIREQMVQKQKLLESLVTPCRVAVLLLEDLNHSRSAGPLKEILFQLDALEEEKTKFQAENAQQIVTQLLAALENQTKEITGG
jgi:hypothetical protein